MSVDTQPRQKFELHLVSALRLSLVVALLVASVLKLFATGVFPGWPEQLVVAVAAGIAITGLAKLSERFF